MIDSYQFTVVEVTMCYSVMLQRAIKDFQRAFPHLVRTDMSEYEARHRSDPKLFPALDDRLFQNRFAPVVHLGGGDEVLVLEHMRYSAFAPEYIENPKTLTTFNARRDNLTSPFWKSAFGVNHGVLLVRGFFEWVEVRDLLRAGVVKLDDVVAEFDAQASARRARFEAAGKPCKPTKTELTDPRFRKIVIQFQAQGHDALAVPVIFNQGPVGGFRVGGFAIVTDEPPPEVRQAGHDRCPVFLSSEGVHAWMRPEGKTPRELDGTLNARVRLSFTHSLDRAA